MDEQKTSTVELLASAFGGNIRDLLEKAYSAGYLNGAAQARIEIKARMDGLWSEPPKPNRDEIKTSPSQSLSYSNSSKPSNRAPKGSVRPVIVEILRKTARGMNTEDIYDHLQLIGRTDIKRNTIRGALNAMKTENTTDKRGKLWFLVQNSEPPAGITPTEEHKDLLELSNGPH